MVTFFERRGRREKWHTQKKRYVELLNHKASKKRRGGPEKLNQLLSLFLQGGGEGRQGRSQLIFWPIIIFLLCPPPFFFNFGHRSLPSSSSVGSHTDALLFAWTLLSLSPPFQSRLLSGAMSSEEEGGEEREEFFLSQQKAFFSVRKGGGGGRGGLRCVWTFIARFVFCPLHKTPLFPRDLLYCIFYSPCFCLL